MRYTQDREASGEILRLAIQKMAGHPATLTPLTYAVWYEFTAGINPALSQELGSYLNEGKKIDDTAIENLYAEFIADRNMNVQRALQKDFQNLLNNFTGFTEETDKQVHYFENSLQAHSESLNQSLDALQIDSLISNMANDATKMSASIQNLQSELKTSKQQVEHLHRELEYTRKETTIDPLTGILNRRGFEEKVKDIFTDKTSTDKGLCLLMADIDNFKKVNDDYGHLFGDSVLRATAEVLKSKIKGMDSVARWGGEEFVVLLPETSVQGARSVAEHIRQSMEKSSIRRLGTNEHIRGITISIGVAEYKKGISVVNLLDQADKALYISKKTGRNKTTVHGQI
jgi:diguanylate cyclase